MGLLFIFSGYVKMVDPMGTAIKFEEYFVSFGMDFFTPAAMFFSFLLNSAEFIIGIALLLGLQMQFTAWCLLLFISFFTVLTFWLAYALDIVALVNRLFGTSYEIFVVTDCGCFGDFLKMTNKQTFYKNVVFIICAVFIFSQRKKFKQQPWYYITQWGPVVLMTGFALFVQIFCLLHEPWHDFRPWKVGNFIAGETYSQAPEVDYVFKYKNNNDQSIKEITLDEMSAIEDFENNYTYLDRAEKIIVPGINAKLSDFTITNTETREDLKNKVITSPDYTFIIIVRDVTTLSEAGYLAIRSLIDACGEQKIDFVTVTASSKEEIDTFNIKHGSDLYFYYSDATPLKTAIRNNPGVILLKEGYVVDKWSYRDIPALGEIVAKMPKYDAQLVKYKKKTPPSLPKGKTMEEYFAKEEAEDND
jgi:uncharacterized membrane protein YphA (DoxX/SURF4 family)